MTQLALAVDATDELWTLDDLPTPAAPYVEVGDELIEVRARFPSQIYSLTGQALPPRIRVRRGIAGTTAASHIQGSTLTPNYGLGGGDGAGGVTVDNQSDDPELIDTLIVGATFGPEGTATIDHLSVNDSVTGASADVSVQAPEDDGAAEANVQALAQLDKAGSVEVYASSDSGAALVSNQATSISGTATARLVASSTTGDTESRLAVLSTDLTQVLAGVVARHVEGVGDSLNIVGGDGIGDLAPPDPGAVLTFDATLGSQWLAPADPLTSDGTIVISADAASVLATFAADGSITFQHAAGSLVTLGADGSFEVNGTGVVRLIGLPSADPEVAGQLWSNVGVLMVSEG